MEFPKLPIVVQISKQNRWVFYPLLYASIVVIYFNFYNFWTNEGWIGVFYSNALRDFTIERFTLPLLYWIGLPIYLWIGEPTFIITGFVFFTVGFVFLVKTLWKDYPLIAANLFFPLFIRPEAANWVMNYSRDALIFMFACIFTYYFAKVWLKRENHYLALIIISILAIYTKTSGLLFVWFTLLIFVRNNHNIIFDGGGNGLFNGVPTIAGIPLWREKWAYKAWFDDLQRIVNSLFDMKNFNPLLFFPNPVFYFSLLAALILRRFTPIMIVLTTLVVGVAIHNISPFFYDSEVVWRYTYALIPINLLVIGEAMNRVILFKRQQ